MKIAVWIENGRLHVRVLGLRGDSTLNEFIRHVDIPGRNEISE